MNTIEKIRAEIERLKEEYTNMMPSIQKCSVCDDLLSFLDTLEEQVPEIKETNTQGLDEAAEKHTYEHFCAGADFTPEYIKKRMEYAFIAGAKWQAEQDKETIELAEEHAYLAGAVNEREKMMKDAGEGYVSNAYTEVFNFDARDVVEYRVELPANTKKVKDGDKVKIIIIKEEENG